MAHFWSSWMCFAAGNRGADADHATDRDDVLSPAHRVSYGLAHFVARVELSLMP